MNQHDLMIGASLTAYFGAICLWLYECGHSRLDDLRNAVSLTAWHFHCGDCLLSWGLG